MKVRAAVMKRPHEISVKEFPFPEIEKNGALVKMKMSGICGTDKHMFRGETMHPGEQESTFPLIPGHENLATIEKLGKKSGRWLDANGEKISEGDRVVPACDVNCGECFNCRNYYGWCWCEKVYGYGTTISCKDPPHLFGGWAEYMYIQPKVYLFKVPEALPDKVAVLAEPMSVAYASFSRAMNPYFLVREGAGPGSNVVIQGTGPLGLSHMIMAKMVGAGKVIAIGAPKERLALAKLFGADSIVDIEKFKTPASRIEEVKRLTEGRGADLVIECVGLPSAMTEGLEMLCMAGTYLVVGNYIDMGDAKINPQKQILSRNARIIGVNGMPYQAYARALSLLDLHWKKYNIDKFVTHSFTIDNAEDALKRADSMKSLKVLVTP